MTIVIKVHYSG